jgi:hypothetical protein
MVRREPENDTMTTTKDGGELSAMGLFKDGLDYDVRTKESALRSHLEGLRREIDRAIQTLDGGNRVSRSGVVLHRGIEIDHLCVVLNELYDVRISLNAALAHDEKNVDLGLHRGNEKGGAK